eukprot:15461331-Alexandrium_andersonii.AAC.3
MAWHDLMARARQHRNRISGSRRAVSLRVGDVNVSPAVMPGVGVRRTIASIPEEQPERNHREYCW